MQPGGKGTKQIAANKKAYHDYFVLDRFEAGLELTGTEVKSIRAGTLNLKDSYCRVVDGELWLIGMHISPYKPCAHPAEPVFQGQPRQARAWAVQGQKAV